MHSRDFSLRLEYQQLPATGENTTTSQGYKKALTTSCMQAPKLVARLAGILYLCGGGLVGGFGGGLGGGDGGGGDGGGGLFRKGITGQGCQR